MKTIKKNALLTFLVLTLCCALCCAFLSACGGGNGKVTPDVTQSKREPPSPFPPPPAPEPPPTEVVTDGLSGKMWSENINKFDMLSRFGLKNVALSQIRDFEILSIDENNEINRACIGGRRFTADELKNYLNLPSDIITGINLTGEEFIFNGKY